MAGAGGAVVSFSLFSSFWLNLIAVPLVDIFVLLRIIKKGGLFEHF